MYSYVVFAETWPAVETKYEESTDLATYGVLEILCAVCVIFINTIFISNPSLMMVWLRFVSIPVLHL